VIEINRITKEVTNNWDCLNKGNYEGFSYPFCVLSPRNIVLYQSSETAATSYDTALANGDVIIAIERQDKIVGKLIIKTDRAAARRNLQQRLSLIILVCFSAFTLVFTIFYYYLHKNIIRPFRNLEEFAKEVANGNLDFALKMNKNNIFGSFTQSFDLMREQLKAAKQKEYLVNQSKKELVASLSHDIKTPITSIKLTSELLLVMTEDEKIKEKLGIINQKAVQINLLVTDLFHAALEDLEELKVNPIEIYSTVLESIIREADCNGRITLSAIPECIIYADPIRLNQVITNILYNSYKYADTPIDISADIKDGFLEIKIQDYGKGVDDNDLPLLFNKFYRGKNAAALSGSGLGLYICKKLLDQMDGEIICSNNEQGFLTTILLELA
jgi:signal transduction histidine kinase